MESSFYTFFKGRVALHALLRASGVSSGDQVLLPGYTCVVVPNAIRYLGAEPVYLDIDPITYNLAPNSLATWLDEHPDSHPKAVLVQHTYGLPCDMDAILPLAQYRNIKVIEDSCHALGSRYKGRQVGTLGDAAFFSSQWSKPVTTGLGGWATVNRPEMEDAMEALLGEYPAPSLAESTMLSLQFLAYQTVLHPRLYWMIQSLYRAMGQRGLAIGSSTVAELSCEEPKSYMKGMGWPQEKLLARNIAKLTKNFEIRKSQQALTESLLAEVGIPRWHIPQEYDPIVLRYPIRVNNKASLLKSARRNRVQLGDWFVSPVHPNETNWSLAGYREGSCPIAERISKTTINIPFGPKISENEIKRTVSFLKQFAEFS